MSRCNGSIADPALLAPREAAPHTSVCCFVVCAATDEEAERRAKVVDLRRLEMAYNLDNPVPTQEMAEQRVTNAEEREYIRSQRARLVHGSAHTCREKLLGIARQFSADEIKVLLSLLFLWAGGIKLVLPIEQLQGPVTLPGVFVRVIGVVEEVSAIGLIFPTLLGIQPCLTSLAAAGLAVLMVLYQ